MHCIKTKTLLRLLFLGALFLALAACGDTPDETSPTLELNAEPSGYTILQSVELSGEAEAGARVEFEREPELAEPVPASAGPNWSGSIPLEDGANMVTITATDDAGNTNLIRRRIISAPYVAAHTPTAGKQVTVPTSITIEFVAEPLPTEAVPNAVHIVVSGPAGAIVAKTENPVQISPTIYAWEPAIPFLNDTVYTVTVSPIKRLLNGTEYTHKAAYVYTFETPK